MARQFSNPSFTTGAIDLLCTHFLASFDPPPINIVCNYGLTPPLPPGCVRTKSMPQNMKDMGFVFQLIPGTLIQGLGRRICDFLLKMAVTPCNNVLAEKSNFLWIIWDKSIDFIHVRSLLCQNSRRFFPITLDSQLIFEI